MSLLISELLHTLGVMVAAFAILSLLAMFLKAEAATADKPENREGA
ncbi:MAG: hypothetical protein GX548_04135 [Lentisphaerae bacterium]|nr:hypothetical protein [Lentisphaerota bacterium]